MKTSRTVTVGALAFAALLGMTGCSTGPDDSSEANKDSILITDPAKTAGVTLTLPDNYKAPAGWESETEDGSLHLFNESCIINAVPYLEVPQGAGQGDEYLSNKALESRWMMSGSQSGIERGTTTIDASSGGVELLTGEWRAGEKDGQHFKAAVRMIDSPFETPNEDGTPTKVLPVVEIVLTCDGEPAEGDTATFDKLIPQIKISGVERK